MNCNDILLQLEQTSSRLAKESILRQNIDNTTLKRVVELALNPTINFYIKKIPDYSSTPKALRPFSLDWALTELTRFSTRELTGNDAINHLQLILKSLSKEDASVIEKVIKRDLRCGVSEATANKIWKGLIPEYPVMLASSFDEKLLEKIKFPAIVQLKLDGMRFNAICKNGKVEFRSRNGKEIDLLGHLEEEFKLLANGDNLVFDGELLVIDKNGDTLNRKTGNGILNKAVKGTISEKEASFVRCSLWDVIPLVDFYKNKCTTPYEERYHNLYELWRILPPKPKNKTRLIVSTIVDNLEEANGLFERYLNQGEEGIILKDKQGIWEAKRVKTQIKFKGELECDLRCIGWEYGSGKNSKRLGNLVLASEDKVIKVSVGTGFGDADRDTITREIIGKIIAIKYNARIKDKKTGQESLFLPVFVEIREDKTVADSSKDIK
jgi:ATP-dependent DNA ligase